jgi:hemerythrin superfamily protein
MFTPRAIASPLARAAFRPQTVRVTARAAFIRTQVAANSTITEAITKDHRELEQYYNEIVNNPDNIDHQTRYGNQFTWELARHSVAEELLVYPAMEKYMGEEGKKHAESDRKQHHQVISQSLVLRASC